MARLRNYLERWIKISGITKDFQGLQDLLIKEQIILLCNSELAMFLGKRDTRNLVKLTEIAGKFLKAQKVENANWKDVTDAAGLYSILMPMLATG